MLRSRPLLWQPVSGEQLSPSGPGLRASLFTTPSVSSRVVGQQLLLPPTMEEGIVVTVVGVLLVTMHVLPEPPELAIVMVVFPWCKGSNAGVPTLLLLEQGAVAAVTLGAVAVEGTGGLPQVEEEPLPTAL